MTTSDKNMINAIASAKTLGATLPNMNSSERNATYAAFRDLASIGFQDDEQFNEVLSTFRTAANF